MVVDRKGTQVAISWFEDFIRDAQIELVPVSVSQAGMARSAWRTFGRGVTRANSILATVLRTRWPKKPANPSCSRATTYADRHRAGCEGLICGARNMANE